MEKTKIIKICLILMCLSLIIAGCQRYAGNKNNNGSNTNEQDGLIVKKTPDYTYGKMKTQIKKLDNKYSTIKVNTIGESYLGRNLYLLKFGSGSKKIITIAGVHGREGLTSLLTLRMIEEYARNYQKNKNIGKFKMNNIYNNVSLYFVPMLNPDGIEIAVNGLENIKNKDFYLRANENDGDFQRWKANARGVDLNKQFKADWEDVESKKNPHYESYKGPAPESEPESRTLASLTRKEDFAAAVCFHHSGRVIYWYYNQTGKQLKRDHKLAELISSINGYDLVGPQDSESRAAGYKDWFIKDFDKPGFTVEIGYKARVEKPLSANRLSQYLKENEAILLALSENVQIDKNKVK